MSFDLGSFELGTKGPRLAITAIVLLLTTAGAASASIVGIVSSDNSSAPTVASSWEHQTSVSPVTVVGNTASFTHTAQLLNQATFSGGVAQTQPRNSAFQLTFTVEDPTNSGFTLDVDQLLRGYSSVTVDAGRGDATGVSYFVQADDSTDAPNTLSNRVDLFLSTGGVNATVDPGQPTAIVREFFTNDSSVVFGSYVGTTDFVLDFTTFFSPTTNVFFQNNSVGSGSINYGLGTLPGGDPFLPADLGHFLTITATFDPVPEPNSLAALTVLALFTLGLTRRRV